MTAVGTASAASASSTVDEDFTVTVLGTIKRIDATFTIEPPARTV